MAKTYNKHILIYYVESAGNYIVTDPKQWARANSQLFPNYTFNSSKETPISEDVGKLLCDNYGFSKHEFKEQKIVLWVNLDPRHLKSFKVLKAYLIN